MERVSVILVLVLQILRSAGVSFTAVAPKELLAEVKELQTTSSWQFLPDSTIRFNQVDFYTPPYGVVFEA
jgi:hypothetical protein